MGLEVTGGFVLLILIGMAAASGIGGGGMVMPIVIIFFGYYAEEAVSLSNFSIMTSGILRFVMNYSQKHPERNERLAIDYDTVLLLLPMVLMGSSVGVLLNKILPSVVIIVLLTIVLLYMAVKTTQRYKLVRNKELEKIRRAEARRSRITELKTKRESIRMSIAKNEHISDNINEVMSELESLLLEEEDYHALPDDPTKLKVLEKIRKREATHFDPRRLLIIFAIFGGMTVISIFRTNKQLGAELGIEKCGVVDWVLFGF